MSRAYILTTLEFKGSDVNKHVQADIMKRISSVLAKYLNNGEIDKYIIEDVVSSSVSEGLKDEKDICR